MKPFKEEGNVISVEFGGTSSTVPKTGLEIRVSTTVLYVDLNVAVMRVVYEMSGQSPRMEHYMIPLGQLA